MERALPADHHPAQEPLQKDILDSDTDLDDAKDLYDKAQLVTPQASKPSGSNGPGTYASASKFTYFIIYFLK